MKPVQFKQTDPILKCVFNTVVVSHLAHETNCKTALSNWMKAWNSIQFDSIQEKKINSQESLLDGVCVRLKGDYERTAFVNPL